MSDSPELTPSRLVPRLPRSPGLLGLVIVAMTGCAPGAPDHSKADGAGDRDGGPVLRLVDSISLEENDTAFLGRVPHTFTVDSGGAVYVADQAADRLLVFTPEGRLKYVLGRHGSGPGEFERIGPITIPDGEVLVQGWGGSTLSLFDLRSGEEQHRIRHRGYIASWAKTATHLVLGTYLGPGQAGVTLAGLESLVASPTTEWLKPSLSVTPDRYRRYPGLELFNQVLVATLGDTLLVGYGAGEEIWRLRSDGSIIDSLTVPRRLRRGASAENFPQYSNPRQSFHDGVSGLSNLLGIWPMTGGRIATWFQDATTESAARPNAEIQGSAYISVLDSTLQRACVDGTVEAPGTGRTRLTFSRDTLFSLDQAVEGSLAGNARVRTVVRKYSLDLAGCRWISTRDRMR